jgi:hypothetical protein
MIDSVMLITFSSGTGPNAKTPGRALPRHIRGQQPGSGAISQAYALPGPVNTAASIPGIIFSQLSGFHPPAACRRLTPLLDIRADWAYCEDIAPDIWQLHPAKY